MKAPSGNIFGVAAKEGSFSSYLSSVKEAISTFIQDNRAVSKIESGNATIGDYHKLLAGLFHQVYFSSTSFALAGAYSALTSIEVRDYLFHHAEEEKEHWKWILEDLESTGFAGPDPRSSFPNWATQAYLSYGVYLSTFNPVGRLAMAHTLEGISGQFGLTMGKKILVGLKLKPEQAKFFFSHGELDQGHSAEIAQVLERASLTPVQWAELANVASTTSLMYRNIYNVAVG